MAKAGTQAQVGTVEVRFSSGMTDPEAPVRDGVEITSRYDGPHGPLWCGYTDDDRRTIVVDAAGTVLDVAWGPARLTYEDEEHERLLEGFDATVCGENLRLRWLRNDETKGMILEIMGAGQRWTWGRRKRGGVGFSRSRDDRIWPLKKEHTAVSDLSAIEAALLVFLRCAGQSLAKPDVPPGGATSSDGTAGVWGW